MQTKKQLLLLVSSAAASAAASASGGAASGETATGTAFLVATRNSKVAVLWLEPSHIYS